MKTNEVKETVGEWRAADERNKLATAADWAARGWDSVANLQEHATAIWACVDEAATAFADTAIVTDIAVVCVVTLKGQSTTPRLKPGACP